MTAKRGVWRTRSSSSGVRNGAVAGGVLRDVGCPDELIRRCRFLSRPAFRNRVHCLGNCRQTLSANPLSGRSHEETFSHGQIRKLAVEALILVSANHTSKRKVPAKSIRLLAKARNEVLPILRRS